MEMNENQEMRAISKDKKKAKERLLLLLKDHPQVFKTGIGAEEFVKEFIKVFTKYTQFSDDEIFALEEASQIIIDFPQIIKPETGAEQFLEDLYKASILFSEYFPKPKR